MSLGPHDGQAEGALWALLELLLWSSAVALVAFGACALVVKVARRYRVARSSSRTARHVGGFVAGLVSGDFEWADVEAGRLLRVNDREGPFGKGWRHLRGRFRRRGRGAAREHPPLELFDAHTVLRCGLAEFTRVVHDAASLAEWFGVVRHPEDASIVIHTRDRTLRLQRVVEQWQPEVGTLMTEARTTDGSRVRSHLTIRAAMAAGLGPARQGVQVWVHVELPADRHGRRVLTCLKPVIEQGLRRLEAEFDTP